MSVYSDLIIADEAQGYWRLDESSSSPSSAVADATTHGYTGSNHISPGAGGGAAFSGAVRSWRCNGAGYIAIASGGTLAHGGGPFSYEAWIKPIAGAYAGSAAPGRDIMSVVGSHTEEETVLHWVWDADAGAGVLRIKNRAEGYAVGVAYAATPDLRDGWHHVVATWDGTSVALYVDGQPLTIDPTITEPAIAALGNPFSAVGAFLACGWDGINAWSGDLDEVAIYGYALSACRVKSHYDAATSGTFTPCRDLIRLSHFVDSIPCWDTDGEITTLYSLGVPKLRTPFLPAGPDPVEAVVLDDTTGVPALSSVASLLTQTVNITNEITLTGNNTGVPMPVQTPSTPVTRRCYVSANMTSHLLTLYGQWQPILDKIVKWAVIGAVVLILDSPLIIPAIAALGATALNIWNKIKPFLQSNWSSLGFSLVTPLTSDQQSEVRQACFCSLQCDASNNIIVDNTFTTAWNGRLGTLTSFSSDVFKVALLSAILTFTPLSDWQAQLFPEGDSHECDLWVCN